MQVGLSWHDNRQRTNLFSLNSSQARSNLKTYARKLGIGRNNDMQIGFHGFRRGRARDELKKGSPISRILELGGWKSSAVLRYLAIKEFDEVTALEVAVDVSESD